MTTGNLYELTDGRVLPVTAEHHGHDYWAWVLHDVDARRKWVITWTDGINHWLEEYELPWHAYARLAALIAAVEQQVFLVHDAHRQPDEMLRFVDEVERFVSRTVHAFNCDVGCDGTDPVTHVGMVSSRHPVWRRYWAMWYDVNGTDQHPSDEATFERQEDLVNWLLNTR